MLPRPLTPCAECGALHSRDGSLCPDCFGDAVRLHETVQAARHRLEPEHAADDYDEDDR